MKRESLTFLLLLSLIATIAAGPVYAQSLNFSLEIPFKFSVGDKAVPAGRYTIRRSPLGTEDVLMIQSSDGRVNQPFRMKIFLSNESAKENKKLIFTKYGEERFLSQIWAISPLGKSTRYQINKSKRELELEKKAKEDQTAEQPELVSVVVK
jgi:hypothetical protein